MPTKYVHLNGHAIYLHHVGNTTLPEVAPDFSRGRTIVFLHGAGSNGNVFHRQLAHLGESHSPFSFDMPAHGRSSGVEGLPSIAEYADLLAKLLDKLEVKTAVVGGHSMGGAIAMDLAARYPNRVSALILLSTAAKFSVPKDAIQQWWSVMMGRTSQPFTTDAFSPKTVKENFDLVRWTWGEQLKTDPRVRYTDIVAVDKVDLRPTLEKIDTPSKVLVGAEDNITTLADAEVLGAKIKGASVQVIADAGHAMPWERPNEVNAAIDGFLGQLK